MRREKLLGFSAVFALAMIVGADHAGAQGQPAQPADASAGLGRQVQLSPAEQLSQSESFLARMDASRSTVRRMLADSRQQRDVVKTLCLNDKLNQIDVAVRSARERRQALELAVKRNDTDLSNHEFTILTVLRQRVDQLSSEANLCVGQEGVFIEGSTVTATIDPTLPDDPSQYPDLDTVITPPACSSCIR